MKDSINPVNLLRAARDRAGLTQRELADRAGKAQSVIARIESGKTSPRVDTLNHLLASAGFEVKAELSIGQVENSHMMDDISRILNLSPEQRLDELKKVSLFLDSSKEMK
ncbi:MAG: helix-turn-helix domain-containing protein [Bacteroidetes bacterium]|jgi:transcriptional regulator with XRE-family HTH domain|nr:helix-turn-helix domain-containing protein [Bacteroidota bacterium]